MDAEELDELSDVHTKVQRSFVSKLSLHRQHGGTLPTIHSNTGLPPSTFGRQTSQRSSLSSLSTDSGFPMSCGSPSPSIDVVSFDDIDKTSLRPSNSVTSPTSPKRVTSYKNLSSSKRFVSVFTLNCKPSADDSNVGQLLTNDQKPKSLSMSNLVSSKFALHPQEFDSQPDVSLNYDDEQNPIKQKYSNGSCSSHNEKERNVVGSVSMTNKDDRDSNNIRQSEQSGTCNSEYPLQTSSPRVCRLSRPVKFPADFRKSFASSRPDASDSSQPRNRDTKTAQLIAKNVVDLNQDNHSHIDSVKLRTTEHHNLLGSLDVSCRPDRTFTDSKVHDAGHLKTASNGYRQVRHKSTGNQPAYHTRLPFTISKLEDTTNTVRKRIPPGMVADMRQVFSKPIKRRQTMPTLSNLKNYDSSSRKFNIPSVSNNGVNTTDELTLTGSSPERIESKAETTYRCYCSGDSSPAGKDDIFPKRFNADENKTRTELETPESNEYVQSVCLMNKNDDGKDDNISDDSEHMEYDSDVNSSELNFYVVNGSTLNGGDEETVGSDDVWDESSDNPDDEDEYNVCASKDDITFNARPSIDPPATLNTPSYIDNILKLSRTSLNYDDTDSKKTQTKNTVDMNWKNNDSLESMHRYSERSFDRVEISDESKDMVNDEVVTSHSEPVIVPRRKVNMYSVINEFKDNDTQQRQSSSCTCIDLHTHVASHEDDKTNTQTKGVDISRDDRNAIHNDRTAYLHTIPNTGDTVGKGNTRLKTDKKNEQRQEKSGIKCSRVKVLPVAIENKCTDGDSSINNTPTRSYVTFDKPRTDDEFTEAWPTPGKRDKPEDDHVSLANNTPPQVETKQCRTSTVVVPEGISSSNSLDYSGKYSERIDNMPERSAGPNNNFSEISEYTGGKKVTTKMSTTDVNMNETSEEAKQTLAILAEAMSKLNGDNNDDILPEIKQSVAKLDGGNLVVTTLTRKIIEEEEESGRGTPLPDYNDVFYVRDHKGNVYMVEDLTEDSQESAYYSSSNVSQENDYNRIHNLRSIGRTSIDHSTAEEVLLGLYNQGRSTVQIEEIDENEKQLVVHKGKEAASLQNQFSTDSSFNKQASKYEYDMCNGGQQLPVQGGPRSTSKIKTIKQCYEMTSDGRNNKDGQPNEEDIKMETEETSTIKNMDSSGCKTMSSSFRYQTDASLVPQVAQEVQAVIPAPMILPPVQPKLVQLDMTPVFPVRQELPLMTTVPVTTTKVTESTSDKIVTSTVNDDAKMKLSEHGRPVYKSVALVKGPYEAPKWQVTKTKEEKFAEDAEDFKRYKLVSSHASNETQQREVSIQNSSSMFHAVSGSTNRAAVHENQNMYKSEQVMQMNGGPVPQPKIHRTRIDVSSLPLPHTDYGGRDVCEYSESNRTITTQKLQSEPVFPARVPSPPKLSASGAEKDMMVVRGNILIKNTMDQGLEQFNDNINMFSKGFNMCKQNPLYQSDEDLQRRLQEEEDNERRRQMDQEDRERRRQMDQEVAFETCDRYSKTKHVKKDPPQAARQHLTSQLLLSKLSNIDVKDIRQHIDVQHHNEDIYGDARFMHADGSSTQQGANNFDSVNENIDLVMRGGKAYITITVTAERYTPIDKEFNVWRKSQAVVTRVIEIDFLANEQRRRLYMSVMERAGESEGDADRNVYGGSSRSQERVLSTKETLDLFSEIMNATEGEGDHEDITVKTKQHRTTLPPHDFLY
ncbi:uncharacterized protein LOC132558288 [Ylistrum balloti]|uniref:uncharacterized protein LOC132558288 n=1 Tax=Ylistrum balloti TaxID=509963 RepID=UPI002905BDF5|nr:uncharacterized protein LOC132558288 [Ylistrum balloti]